MRQLTLRAAGDLAWEDVPDPALTDQDSALVRPLAIARCDLDAPMAAAAIFPAPFPVGHEVVAEVVEVGADVREHRPGERVVVPFQVSCGRCVACAERRFAACHPHRAPAGAAFGFGAAGGGHGGAVAERLVVPHADHMLCTAPSELSDAAACTLPDNALDGYRAVGPQLAARPGADVLIVGGAGPSIGLYAGAMARALGASTVRYVDRDAGRCANAERLGADVTQLDGEWPRRLERAPIVVENSGEPAGLACAIRSTDDYGTLTPVAIHFAAETPLPLLSMYTKGVTVELGRADSRRHLDAVLALAADRRFDPSAIDTTIVPFDDAREAWLAPATKLVVTGA